MLDLTTITISQHAKERYAERIMSREDKCGIHIFISDHEEKIAKDIVKMIKYGEKIYSGKSLKDKNKNCDVYLCDLWVILIDIDANVVITLFKIDLGVGDEFNKSYVDNVIEKLNKAKEEFEIYKNDETQTIREAHAELEKNRDQIDELKRQVKRLEETNAFLNELIKESNAKITSKEFDVRHIVELLTANKSF